MENNLFFKAFAALIFTAFFSVVSAIAQPILTISSKEKIKPSDTFQYELPLNSDVEIMSKDLNIYYQEQNREGSELESNITLLSSHTPGVASLFTLDENNNSVSGQSYGPFDGWEVVDYHRYSNNGYLLWGHTAGNISLKRLILLLISESSSSDINKALGDFPQGLFLLSGNPPVILFRL